MDIREALHLEHIHQELLVALLAQDLQVAERIEDQTAALEAVLLQQRAAPVVDLHQVAEAIDHLAAQAEAVVAQAEVALDHHLVLAEEEEEISR